MKYKNIEIIDLPKILAVDDRPENLIALERSLSDMPIELFKATSGNEALKLTLYHDFALALLDIQMPEMDGFELAEILRSETKTAKIPFIFLSAIYTDQMHVFKGYERGAFSFITKPFEPMVLKGKIEFFIEKHQQEQMLIEAQKQLSLRLVELEEKNKEMESFSYTVSHDLRGPLRAIDGYSRFVVSKYSETLDPTGQRYLNVIMQSAQRMGQLIDDILEFSRLGRQDISKTNFKLTDLAQEVITTLSEQDQNKANVQIQDLPEVYGDYNLLRQVMTNLVSNAIKYSSKKETPMVEIGSLLNDGKTVFYVKDNGAGFDMKYYDKLFGVFQRLHHNGEFQGNGVGLAFVKRIIDRHHGKIWAEAELEKGATFYFTLNELNKQT